MGRVASDATLLRAARAELKRERSAYENIAAQRDAYRARATKAEQELAEWKARFDILLRREEAAK
jgi:FtsZ-binding cell division protein ZapB